MDKQKLISTIKQEFMLKRCRAQETAELFLENLKQDNEFNDLYSKIMNIQFKKMKAELEQEKQKLNDEYLLLKGKIDRYLESKNIDKSKLTPHYDCKRCEDTGVYNGKICDCLLSEMNKKLSFKSCGQTVFKKFSD